MSDDQTLLDIERDTLKRKQKSTDDSMITIVSLGMGSAAQFH